MSEFDGKYKFGAILEVLKGMLDEKNRVCDGKSSETKETKSYLGDCVGKNDEKYEQIMNEDGKSSETKSAIDKKLQEIRVNLGEIGEGFKKMEPLKINFLKEVDFSHYKETFDKILKEWKREIEEEDKKMNNKSENIEKNAQSTDISSEKIGDLVQNSGEKGLEWPWENVKVTTGLVNAENVIISKTLWTDMIADRNSLYVENEDLKMANEKLKAENTSLRAQIEELRSGKKNDIFCKEKLDERVCGGNIDDFLEKTERVKRENEGDFNDILACLKWPNTRKSGADKGSKTCENDNVSHPKHYQSSNGVECIDAIEAATEDLTGLEAVCTANVLKYIWRWKRKNGLEDLKKARWYLDKLIRKLE